MCARSTRVDTTKATEDVRKPPNEQKPPNSPVGAESWGKGEVASSLRRTNLVPAALLRPGAQAVRYDQTHPQNNNSVSDS